MSDPLYTAHAELEKLGSLHRRARLETGETFDMGVHGPVVQLFGLQPERELPLPVDYIVAATAG
ncbi:MAG: hypothetical protein HYR73_07380 [Candidatus Eisenbacteria bacterium]|nr:hypothetical protein [Candidatus Eisenbacteria bacterium]